MMIISLVVIEGWHRDSGPTGISFIFSRRRGRADSRIMQLRRGRPADWSRGRIGGARGRYPLAGKVFKNLNKLSMI